MNAKPPGYANNLSDFVGDLRSKVFSSQKKAAAYFNLDRSTITRYENGMHSPPIGYLLVLAELVINHLEAIDVQNIDSHRETLLQEVNKAVRLSLKDEPFKNWAELHAEAGAYLVERQQNAKHQTGEENSYPRPDIPFILAALKDWNNDFFKWTEAPEHIQTSWTGKVIYGMSVIAEKFTLRGLLVFSLGLLFGIITIQLMSPVLEWPLVEIKARQTAYLRYGLGTLLIPLLVSIAAPPDRDDLFQLKTLRQRITFWALKFSGALVGFWLFSMLIISAALVSYYLYLPPLTYPLRGALSLIPLFFSYVVARRIPADRHKMFNGKLRMHPVDRFLLVVFVLLGPFIALSLYVSYEFTADRKVAPLTIAVLLTGLALWEYRKRHRHALSDPVLILLLGFVMPGFLLLYGAFALPNQPPVSRSDIPYLLIFADYFLGWTLLGVTIFVRNPPVLTIRGVLTALAVMITAGLSAVFNRLLGAGVIFVTSLLWFLWGKKRFKQYFSVHYTAWIMIAATGISLYLLASNAIPLWLNGLGFVSVFAILTVLAYKNVY